VAATIVVLSMYVLPSLLAAAVQAAFLLAAARRPIR
jgi:hypothetical protein